MGDFFIYDVVLMAVFVVFLLLFIYRNKKNLKREGILLLYKAKWGIKLIEKVGKKYDRALNVLSYVSVGLGYLLMAGVLYFAVRIVWVYLTLPDVVKAIKVPPITPLIPYLPEVFQLDFLPPFYFIYWIVIIGIVAIAHEFAHGIFAAKNKIEIKKTGFGFFPFFLPVFVAAFVEPDEKQMEKKGIFKQLAVLSAGVFANVLTAVLFFFVLIGFFAVAFTPAGITYDNYAYTPISVSSVSSVNGVEVDNPTYQNVLERMESEGWNEIEAGGGGFLVTEEMWKGTGWHTGLLLGSL